VKRPERADPPSKPATRPQLPKAAATTTVKTAQHGQRPNPRPEVHKERSELRRLRAERRRYEKQEVRRFTRRARLRRGIIFSAVSSVAVLAIVISFAVFSPVLALRTITITGTSRLDPAEVSSALSDQLGKPLALVDFAEITRKLADFPLIRSYTTESDPPHTLVVSIVERVPVAAVSAGAGFHSVDPAGVTVESSAERPPSLPLIELENASIKDRAFRSVVKVLLALPKSLLASVDTITATTNDDVTFVLVGAGQSVLWGSSDRSSYKARVLSALLATQNPAAHVEYDVSAPDSVVVRPK
jgi:cell division protein FtsQ